MNEFGYWECFLCAAELHPNILPSAYLSNYHSLCSNCAKNVISDTRSPHRSRITYYEDMGDIKMISDIPVRHGYSTQN
jgi:hypothetical protein